MFYIYMYVFFSITNKLQNELKIQLNDYPSPKSIALSEIKDYTK